MGKFTDTITIKVRAGHGGPGSVSFLREKYVPKGGPDGGDGGVGGNVIIESDRRYYNLAHLFSNKIYKAKAGSPGMSANRHGKDGEHLIIKVPPGTQIIDSETEEILYDLIEENDQFIVATGGIGGKGNAFFKSSTFQTPRFAQPGMAGEEKIIELNLKLIADIGLVGLPNAGKSTLLSKITNAKPKIANYPFTTLIPNLGVIERNNIIYTIADIPGIIEGAHQGHGLGLSFLQHIERVKIILYLLDITEDDLLYNLSLLKSELKSYNETLLTKPSIVVLTKTDLLLPELVAEIEEQFSSEKVISISSLENENLERLLDILNQLMEQQDES